jgi:hypothetical protein
MMDRGAAEMASLGAAPFLEVPQETPNVEDHQMPPVQIVLESPLVRRLLKYWSGSRCCGFWRWPRREAQCRYPQRSRPSEQRRPAPKSTQPLRARGRRAAGCVARSFLAIRPSASTRDPFQYFNSLLGESGRIGRMREKSC